MNKAVRMILLAYTTVAQVFQGCSFVCGVDADEFASQDREAIFLNNDPSKSLLRKPGVVSFDKMRLERSFSRRKAMDPDSSVFAVTTCLIIRTGSRVRMTDSLDGDQQYTVERLHSAVDMAEKAQDSRVRHCEAIDDELVLGSNCSTALRPFLNKDTQDDRYTIEEVDDADYAQMESTNLFGQSLWISSWLHRVIPANAFSPGDSWPVKESDSNGYNALQGTMKLVGYREYHGTDCAVMSLTAFTQMSRDTLQRKMGLSRSNTTLTREKSLEANVSVILYWDYQGSLVRWSQTNTSAILEEKNPLDGSFQNFPMKETLILATEISLGQQKESHDHDDEIRLFLWFFFLIGLTTLVSSLAQWRFGEKKTLDKNAHVDEETLPIANIHEASHV